MIDWEQKCEELEALVEQLEDSNRFLQEEIDDLKYQLSFAGDAFCE